MGGRGKKRRSINLASDVPLNKRYRDEITTSQRPEIKDYLTEEEVLSLSKYKSPSSESKGGKKKKSYIALTVITNFQGLLNEILFFNSFWLGYVNKLFVFSKLFKNIRCPNTICVLYILI